MSFVLVLKCNSCKKILLFVAFLRLKASESQWILVVPVFQFEMVLKKAENEERKKLSRGNFPTFALLKLNIINVNSPC
jgi:hypothetical protein